MPTRPDSCRSTRSARGVPPRPLRTAAAPSYPDALSHPGAQTESPRHPDTPRGPRPSHAQLAPWARDKSRPRPGRGHRGRRSPGPASSGHTPPTCPGAGGRRAAGSAPSGRASAPGPRGEAGPRAGQPAAGANPGPGPCPPPPPRGSPGGEWKPGSLGSGWSPSFPSSPHGAAGSRAEGRPAQAFLPPPPDVPGTWDGVSEREKGSGRGEREGQKSPSASIYGHQCAVSFVSTVNVCVCVTVLYSWRLHLLCVSAVQAGVHSWFLCPGHHVTRLACVCKFVVSLGCVISLDFFLNTVLFSKICTFLA